MSADFRAAGGLGQPKAEAVISEASLKGATTETD